MELSIHLEGTTKKVGLYNLDQLELEGIESDAYDLTDREDLLRYMEDVDALVESGELDLLEAAEVVTGIDPESLDVLTVTVDGAEEQALERDALTLKNIPITDPLAIIQRAEPGEIFYLRSEEGPGILDLGAESDEETFRAEETELGYYDCSMDLDTYAILTESFFDTLCDTLVPTRSRYGKIPLEVESFDFKPAFIRGALYRVILDPQTGDKTLERLPCPDRIFLDESEEEI